MRQRRSEKRKVQHFVPAYDYRSAASHFSKEGMAHGSRCVEAVARAGLDAFGAVITGDIDKAGALVNATHCRSLPGRRQSTRNTGSRGEPLRARVEDESRRSGFWHRRCPHTVAATTDICLSSFITRIAIDLNLGSNYQYCIARRVLRVFLRQQSSGRWCEWCGSRSCRRSERWRWRRSSCRCR